MIFACARPCTVVSRYPIGFAGTSTIVFSCDGMPFGRFIWLTAGYRRFCGVSHRKRFYVSRPIVRISLRRSCEDSENLGDRSAVVSSRPANATPKEPTYSERGDKKQDNTTHCQHRPANHLTLLTVCFDPPPPPSPSHTCTPLPNVQQIIGPLLAALPENDKRKTLQDVYNKAQRGDTSESGGGFNLFGWGSKAPPAPAPAPAPAPTPPKKTASGGGWSWGGTKSGGGAASAAASKAAAAAADPYAFAAGKLSSSDYKVFKQRTELFAKGGINAR